MTDTTIIAPLFTWRTAIIKSTLKPTTRHVLITLSLHMSEAGDSAFPSTKTLSKETGLSERAVIQHLKIAVESGWLKKSLHGYSKQNWKRHQYHPLNPLNAVNGSKHLINKGADPHAEGTYSNDVKALTEGQSNTSINSSDNSSKEKTPPYQKIIDSYNEILAAEGLPKVSKLTPRRKKHINARCKDDPLRLEPAYWPDFFIFIRDRCPFLMDNKSRGWFGFDWIIKNEDNFVKIAEGNYLEDEAA